MVAAVKSFNHVLDFTILPNPPLPPAMKAGLIEKRRLAGDHRLFSLRRQGAQAKEAAR